jgi:hypothetical protein
MRTNPIYSTVERTIDLAASSPLVYFWQWPGGKLFQGYRSISACVWSFVEGVEKGLSLDELRRDEAGQSTLC